MAIRPPRPARRPRAASHSGELVVIAIMSMAVVLFGLRVMLALASIGEWTIFWRVVELPTNLLVRPIELVPQLDRLLIGQLSVAEALAAGIIGVGALFALSSLALRRR